MTLIITAATKRYVFQVADTRLTYPDGQLYDDQSVKTTLATCYDAKLAISYTGLAVIGGQSTDLWLCRELTGAKVWERSFPDVVQFLKDRLTGASSHDYNLRKIGLTFVIAGLGINKGARDVALALVTNCRRPIPRRSLLEWVQPKEEFNRYFFDPGDNFTWYLSVHGAVDMNAEISALRRKIGNKLLEARAPEQLTELMNYLVSWIRFQRRSKRVGHLISDDCTVVHIGSDFKGSLFLYSKDKRLERYPHIVSKPIPPDTVSGPA